MRRILLIAVLVLLVMPACTTYPGRVADVPIFGPARVRGSNGMPPAPPPRPVSCREVGRVACDFLTCKGPGFDLVSVQCAGQGAMLRCVPNGGCAMASREQDE